MLAVSTKPVKQTKNRFPISSDGNVFAVRIIILQPQNDIWMLDILLLPYIIVPYPLSWLKGLQLRVVMLIAVTV